VACPAGSAGPFLNDACSGDPATIKGSLPNTASGSNTVTVNAVPFAPPRPPPGVKSASHHLHALLNVIVALVSSVCITTVIMTLV
jgi:hypothetical protein